MKYYVNRCGAHFKTKIGLAYIRTMSLRKKKTQHKKRPQHKKIPEIGTFLSSFCFCGNFAIFFSHPHIWLSPKSAHARKFFPQLDIFRALFPPKETREKSYQENKHKRGEADNPKKSYRLLFMISFFVFEKQQQWKVKDLT